MEPNAAHHLDPTVLIGVAVMLIVAKIGGEIFERLKQPAVLGELFAGIVLGNLVVFGFTTAEPLKTNDTIAALAELGVIILLFEVGLESDLKEMMEVGWSSLLVAVVGVVAPFFLGWSVSSYFLPNEPQLIHVFIGATLCATSVGITARVFKDLGKLATREARIILGAAVIDDVLGLLILAIVSGAIRAAARGGVLSIMEVVWIAVTSVLFLIGSIVIGHFLMPRLLRGAGRLDSRGSKGRCVVDNGGCVDRRDVSAVSHRLDRDWSFPDAAITARRGPARNARRVTDVRDFDVFNCRVGGRCRRARPDRWRVCRRVGA